jgi:hypothetical protein
VEEAVVAEFKVVLEETTKNLRLLEVSVPVEILTEHVSDTREKPYRVSLLEQNDNTRR